MEKLKKISLGLILMLCICFSNKAYATVGCNARVTAQRQEVTIDEEVNVTLSISNIQGENGILVIGGVLEYDKNYLTLIGRSAGDMWSLSYNGTTGQFVADRDGFTKSNESVVTFRFKAIKTGNTNIAVKSLLVTDASEEKNVNGSSTAISIKAKNSGNQGGNQGGNQDGNQGGNNQGSNQGGNNQGGSSNQGGNQGSNSNQGNKPINNNSNNNNNNNPQAENTNNNTNNDTNQSNSTDQTVTGIDTNRVPDQNTANANKNNFANIQEEQEYPEVKLYKQKSITTIIYIACGVGVVLIGVIIFVGKKMIEKAR